MKGKFVVVWSEQQIEAVLTWVNESVSNSIKELSDEYQDYIVGQQFDDDNV